MSDAAPAEQPEYISVETVRATIIDVSDKTLYRWATDPTCPVLRVGAVVRFHRERFRRWLLAREQGAARPRAVRGAGA